MNVPAMVEALEDRIAPASTLTFTDVDGDLVTITSSKGIIANAGFSFNDMNANTGIPDSQQLAKLDISDAQFAGTNLTIIAKPQNGLGDGFVNVGWIEAGTNNLGMVKIDGDLGEIDAGNSMGIAIKKLEVQSIGNYGTTTGGGAGLKSEIAGGVDSLIIKGDVRTAWLDITGSTKTVDIKGSLVGGTNDWEGHITISQASNALKIGGSMIGAAGTSSGTIIGGFKTVTIGGDVRGGGGADSGRLAASAAKVTINGSLQGGAGMVSGIVDGAFSVSVKYSVVGGDGSSSGVIVNIKDNGSVKIGGSLVGGGAVNAGRVTTTGADNVSIAIGGDIVGGTDIFTGMVEVANAKKVTVGGSIYGASGGVFLAAAGGIYAEETLGDVSVKGSVFGENGRAFIIARDFGNTTGKPAIGKLTIGGSVDGLDILAGYELNFMTGDYEPFTGDASIGAVKVGGNWSASNLVAGVETANTNTGFRTNDTTLINGHDPAIIAKIVSLAIGGQGMGLAENPYFNGIVAEQVPQKFKVGKKTFTFFNATDVLAIGSTYSPNNMGLNFLAYRVTTT